MRSPVSSFNTAIGRVAFALGLEGPAMAVDTACSLSLVAMHQAVSGLQRSETDLALAGGVHAIFSGRLLEMRANAGMLSPDGQCKTFDASANGYVRGEGCGIVVLKRLAEAQTDGDRIWGVIRGSAVNQDGASLGLMVPNAAAQERVIEAALARAGVRPSDVDYLEAHGTGTEVGDPIEINATAAACGRGRDQDRPLLISARSRPISATWSRWRGGAAASWKRSREPTRRGWRSTSQGSSRARPGVESRCRSIRSSVGATGSGCRRGRPPPRLADRPSGAESGRRTC